MILRHFITTLDYSKEELLEYLELIRLRIAADQTGNTQKLLSDASQVKIFEESFADSQIGITARFLDESTIHITGLMTHVIPRGVYCEAYR
jgi:hypothetical protein